MRDGMDVGAWAQVLVLLEEELAELRAQELWVEYQRLDRLQTRCIRSAVGLLGRRSGSLQVALVAERNKRDHVAAHKKTAKTCAWLEKRMFELIEEEPCQSEE
jgi:hypothetical protein